jgi:hypothetical protein
MNRNGTDSLKNPCEEMLNRMTPMELELFEAGVKQFKQLSFSMQGTAETTWVPKLHIGASN